MKKLTKLHHFICIAALLTVFTNLTSAQEDSSESETAEFQTYDFNVEDGIDESVRSSIVTTLSQTGTLIHSLESTPIRDLYLVRTQGDDFLYISGDGKYLLLGDLYELRSDSFANLTDQRRQEIWKESLASAETIDFAPEEGDIDYVVHVFTDISCGYCRQLHRNMDLYNELGIEIRYLAYPRAGKGSESYQQMVSAWCSDDPKAAMTVLKNGGTIDAKECENTIDEQMILAQKMGLRGTPMLVLPSGQTIPGAVGPEDLLSALQQFEDS